MLFIIGLPCAQALRYLEWKNDITIYDDSTFTIREIHVIGTNESKSFFRRTIDIDGQKKINDVRIFNEKGLALNLSFAYFEYSMLNSV